jgi:hypothetical protein
LNIAFNDGLTGECVALLDISRGKAQCASSPNVSIRHLYGTTTAASLSAARLANINACDVCGTGQHRVGGDFNDCCLLVFGGEGDGMFHVHFVIARRVFFPTKHSPTKWEIASGGFYTSFAKIAQDYSTTLAMTG